MKVLVSGATGFVGTVLCAHLRSEGDKVVALTRRPTGPDQIKWSPSEGLLDRSSIEGFDAFVHLAGEPIGQRWTADRRALIWDSRVNSTRLLVAAIAKLKRPPSTLLCASAIGIYGDAGQRRCDESHPAGTGFTPSLCEAWERAASQATQLGLRVIQSRMGLALHPSGGLLKQLMPIYQFGLGGTIGVGSQWVPWVDRTDSAGAIAFALRTPSMSGPFNNCAPLPVQQSSFARSLAAATGRPCVVPTPACAIHFAYGEMGRELILWGQRAQPSVLKAAGFYWREPSLNAALFSYLKSHGANA